LKVVVAAAGKVQVKMMEAVEREDRKDWEALDHLDVSPVSMEAIEVEAAPQPDWRFSGTD